MRRKYKRGSAREAKSIAYSKKRKSPIPWIFTHTPAIPQSFIDWEAKEFFRCNEALRRLLE